jgi:hypothetical protein
VSALSVTPNPAVPRDADWASSGAVVLSHAAWPESPTDGLPTIGGFVTSSFSPLVAELAERCLRRYFGPPPADAAMGRRTGVLLASGSGDIATAAAIAQAVDGGLRVPPLLFFQSNPNAVVGHVTARWGLAGPVICTMPEGDALADAHRGALLLLEDGDADAVLVILAEQARAAGGRDHGIAQLVGPSSWPAGSRPAEPLGQLGQVNGGGA